MGGNRRHCGGQRLAPLLALLGVGMAVAAVIPDNFLDAESAPMYESVKHPQPPSPSLWGSTRRPLPTNSWWMNFVLDMGEGVVAPLPFHVKASLQGMVVCFPWVDVSQTVVFPPFIENLAVQLVEKAESRKVVAYDDLSVTLEWRREGGGGSMTSPVVRGAPYATFILDNATPMFSTVHAIVDTAEVNREGRRFVVSLNNGQRWVIYASEAIGLSTGGQGANVITASAPFTGVIRVAIVPPGEREVLTDMTPNAAFQAWLDENKDIYPTGGKAVLEYEGNQSRMRFEFETQSMNSGSGALLMMAMPHHTDTALQTAGMGKMYRTTYGFMTGVLGASWDLGEDLPTIDWYAPRPIDPSRIDAIRTALIEDVESLSTNAPDPYFFGKQISAMARLALIADQLGETDIAADCRNKVKEAYMPWLMAENEDAFVYDEDWGGLVPTLGLMDIGRDFGAGWYNDHHFHQGYHLYAMAVVTKEDPAFLTDHRERLLDLVRNFGNPNRNDRYYTFARHKDFYAGHSWASGIIPNFGERANQESTSEAINAYYAIQLFGRTLENKNLEQFGRILLATELRSAAKYWQITSADDVYPKPFADNKVVGIRWATKADYATFFGANIEFIFGIQFLPFNPISELHLRKEWMLEAYPKVATALSSPELGSSWRGFIYMAHGVIDPVAAWNEITTELDGPYDNGNSKTNALYWVATRPTPGVTPSPSPLPSTSPLPSPSPMPTPSPTPDGDHGVGELSDREKHLVQFIINGVFQTLGNLRINSEDVMDLEESTTKLRRLAAYEMPLLYPKQFPSFMMSSFEDDV